MPKLSVSKLRRSVANKASGSLKAKVKKAASFISTSKASAVSKFKLSSGKTKKSKASVKGA